jgi:choline dehydrogenase
MIDSYAVQHCEHVSQRSFETVVAAFEALAACVELVLDIASQPAYGDLVKRWIVPPTRMCRERIEAFIRGSCSSYLHPVGTCAMGRGEEAVVDAELRIHGVQGLCVADASVMPAIPSANTNAPTVMIGEFASQLLVVGRSAAGSAPRESVVV